MSRHCTAGKSDRNGISIIQLFQRFPDDATAEAWFVNRRWPNGIECPHCGSKNVQTGAKHKSMPYRCRSKECAKRFSAKTGTVMESSKLGFQVWMIATYLLSTSLKSVSSMKLHRDMNINQRSAWFLAHRLRVALAEENPAFAGPVEADETYVGGRERNKHAKDRLKAGRGGVGKAIVLGAKDRETNHVAAKGVPDTKAKTLQSFVEERTEPTAQVYTDDASAYVGIKRRHESVRHSAGQYVRGDVHTNGMESFWSMLKRAHKGTFHKFSKKHMHRYVDEFVTRHNLREGDTICIMAAIANGGVGKRLRYKELIADNGLPSGARS